MATLAETAPAFIEMAHRIVWCVAATVDDDGRPATRVLHPIWSWDGAELTGWVATAPTSPKGAHLAQTPAMSLTYWANDHDTCTADCDATWEDTPAERRAGWDRFAQAAPPLGYDPAIIPGWDSPESPDFGIVRLNPRRLRVMPGSVMLQGSGRLLTWRR